MRMRHAASCLLLAVLASAVSGQDAAPYLALDAGGHTASISRVRFLPDGQRLATAANDKTIRLWDVRSGECLEVLRPPRGPGAAGVLHALALSPDGKWLDAGGLEAPGADHGVYLIDFPQRRLATVLRGHTNAILDLAFSPDGRLLASASADRTVRLWNVVTAQDLGTLRGHAGDVYAVAFAPDGLRVATASLDHTARVWTVSGARTETVLRGHSAPLQAIAWRPDGRQLATGSVDESLGLWSPQGQLQQRLTNLGNHVTALRYLPDARGLFCTLGGPGNRDGGLVLDLATRRPRTSFVQHADSVLTGDLSRDGAVAATADAAGEACLWRTRDGSLLHRLRGAGRRPWSAAWDAASPTIAWGNTSRYAEPNDRGPLEFAFSLHQLEWAPLAGLRFERASPVLRAGSLAPLDAGSLTFRRTGAPHTTLRLPAAHDQIRCYTLLDEQTAAVGSDFGLFLFDVATGRMRKSLQGHSGPVWAVSPSPDGRWLLSASGDQTLAVWAWREGRLLLSLFFASRDWIAWTPEGYYAASPGGERLMGWHVPRGPDQFGSFFPAARFRKSLYRPDVIRRLLESQSSARALAEIAAETGRPEGLTSIERVLPPTVRIVEPATRSLVLSEPRVRVRAEAQTPAGHRMVRLRLLLDGRPYEGQKGVHVVPLDAPSASPAASEWTVEVTPGTHQVAVLAETDASQGVSEAVEIHWQPETLDAARRPDLYVLAAGIAAYPEPLRLEYAAKDARLVAHTLEEACRPLFRRVQTRLLTDGDAARRDFLAGLSWLRKDMTQQDVAIVFFSGHGAKDEQGNFYLVPSDGDPADLLASAISGNQFKEALASIPGRVLVLLDACHAGAAGGDRRKGVYVTADDLVRDLATDDYGVVVMCSSMGREVSRESSEHQQGFFTLALVEALRGKADYNGDGIIYLTEIDAYVSDRVKELTLGQQHPVTTKPATIRSFPVSQPPKSERPQ